MRVIANGTEFRVCECNDGSVKAFGKGNALMAPYDIERNCIVQCISYIATNGNKCERREYARCKDMPGVTSSCSPVLIDYEGKCIQISGSEWKETIVPCELIDNSPIEHCTYEIISYYNVRGIECPADNNATATEVHEDVTTKDEEHKVHVDVTTPMQPAELEAIQNVDNSNENVDNVSTHRNVETSINQKQETRNVETYEQPELQQQICFPEDSFAHSQLDSIDTHFGMKKALKVIGIVLSVAGAMWLGNTVSGVFDNDFVSSIVYTVVTFFTGGVGVCLSLGVGE